MANDLSGILANDRRHANLSPERLEMMGKEAANRLLNDGLPLNEGIAKLAAEHNDITQQQVMRVCEFANTAVYLAQHDQSKTAGAASSYPQFDLADPNRIIQNLSDGARSTVVTPTDIEYSRLPRKFEKTSSAQSDDLLAGMFGVKTASAEPTFTTDTALHELLTSKDMLVGLQDHLAFHRDSFSSAQSDAEEGYYVGVKNHLLEGGSFADVVNAAESTGIGAEKVAAVLGPVIERLMSEKVASAERLSAGLRNLEKVAHRAVNPSHPFAADVLAIASFRDEIEKLSSAHQEATEQLAHINEAVRATVARQTR